jgi:hypothetical protein
MSDLDSVRQRALCEACAAEIFWTVTQTGKLMPVDWTPVEGGNLDCYVDGEERVRSRVVSERTLQLDGGGEVRFVSHFVSCPDDAEHFHRPTSMRRRP